MTARDQLRGAIEAYPRGIVMGGRWRPCPVWCLLQGRATTEVVPPLALAVPLETYDPAAAPGVVPAPAFGGVDLYPTTGRGWPFAEMWSWPRQAGKTTMQADRVRAWQNAMRVGKTAAQVAELRAWLDRLPEMRAWA